MSKETCFVHGRFRPAHSGIFTHCTCPKEETPMNVDRKYAPPLFQTALFLLIW